MTAARSPLALAALAAAFVAAGCGGPPEPDVVEQCLIEGGDFGVAQQRGLSPPVDAKVNYWAASGTPEPGQSAAVIFYASEQDATRNLKASGGSGSVGGEIRQEGQILYQPFGAAADGGLTSQESETLVESCVTSGSPPSGAEEDDSDSKKKKRKKR